MKFTAIDFETANSSMLSACSIGVVEFEDGIPVRETYTLIRPPEECGKFNWYNVRIHGIKPAMVKDAPTFDEVWKQIHASIEGQLIVCHNAVFDTAVLCRLVEYYGFPKPTFDYVCTVKISQLIWPDMENHKLDTVCNDLHIVLNHHEALSDARGCGMILAEALKQKQYTDIEPLLEDLHMQIGRISPNERQSCSTSEEIRRKMLSDQKKQKNRRKYFARKHHTPPIQTQVEGADQS